MYLQIAATTADPAGRDLRHTVTGIARLLVERVFHIYKVLTTWQAGTDVVSTSHVHMILNLHKKLHQVGAVTVNVQSRLVEMLPP